MILLILIVATISLIGGWEAAYIWNWLKAKHALNKEYRALQERAATQSLMDTIESVTKTLEESVKQLNPPHDKDCACAYCEIKYGPVDARTPAQAAVKQLKAHDTSVHPDYVRALKTKIKQLEDRNAQLNELARNNFDDQIDKISARVVDERKKLVDKIRAQEKQIERLESELEKISPRVYGYKW